MDPRVKLALAVVVAAACGNEKQPEHGATGDVAAATSTDPCSLLTRAEAEAVLGTLVAAPYRSKADTAVADSGGPGCVYATEGGKILLLTPEWTYGKMTLDAERLIGGLVRQVADLPGMAADTLEGQWDDAVVGMKGELLLRKGARSLMIDYTGSSTDASGAIKLSGPALTRLAAAPEPPRPAVSANGCPLAPEVVTKILELPVRLTPTPVQLLDACSYELVEDPTVHLELEIKPASLAEMLFEGVRARAKGVSGSAPDSLEFGDSGWAYGSASGSEAAVQKGEHLFHAVMAYPLSTTTGSLKEAMVRLVAAMMSGAK